MLKRFFYASAAILMLAIAFHVGASTATAQAPSNPVVAAPDQFHAFASNGDEYVDGAGNGRSWVLVGNVFTGTPTPALHESFGQLKARYR